MAYVMPTFFIMGFGYFVAVTALEQPLPARWAAWAGFWLGRSVSLLAAVPILLGRASVLYTFYPPLSADASYYIGILLVVAGSWIWMRPDDRGDGLMEAGKPRQASAAGDVRDRRQCHAVALDDAGRRVPSCCSR